MERPLINGRSENQKDLGTTAFTAQISLTREYPQIVQGRPARFVPKRALNMGLQADNSIHEIIHAFIEDELQQSATGAWQK